MTTVDLARVSALLDEVKEEILIIAGLWPGQAVRAHRKVDEAQRLLVGDKPTCGEDN